MSFPFDYAWHDNDEVSDEVLLNRVRIWRSRELADCDWTQLPDAPVDAVAWAEYRQALRDLPNQDANVRDLVYPVKP